MTAQPPLAGLRPMVVDTPRVYTDSQAGAGQAVWAKTCAECHGSSDLTGADFRTKWSGQPLFTLYEQIRTTMPDGNPGTLSREEYAATLADILLKLNGLPAGDAKLEADSVALSAITLTLPPAPPAP
jgi:mono/diheme cytochrome c family protein